MEHPTHYGTVSEALEKFRKQGFTIDFNVQENGIAHELNTIHADDFEIVDVYRYEGSTDPADEATVYAIKSKSGKKGVLVTGYGFATDTLSETILKKLQFSHQ